MYCEACGKKIPEDSKFCEFCGHPVKAEVKPIIEPKLPVEEPVVIKPKVTKPIKKPTKPKSKSKLMPILLVVLIVVGGYFAMSFLGMDELLTKIKDFPNLIFGNESKEPTREDFSWYVPMSYDVVPEDGVELTYKDILGNWKVMVVNYVSEPEETYFSTVRLKESSSDNNTSVDFTHHYVEYDGQKYPFEGDEAKDLLYGNYMDGYLSLVFGDDETAEIIFWSKDGKEYGQSHIYFDWDNDGIADLTTVILFTR